MPKKPFVVVVDEEVRAFYMVHTDSEENARDLVLGGGGALIGSNPISAQPEVVAVEEFEG